VAVWSGWVGIGQMTGFGMVRPLPGIVNSLRVDTAITLPLGVEAYAAYALRAWLTADQSVSTRTRQFARWSAIGSLLLGMAGQVAYHRLAQAGATRAPWGVTTLVSCLPVLVLGMGAALAHMIHADQSSAGTGATEPVSRTARPAPAVPAGDVADQDRHLAAPAGSAPADQEQSAYPDRSRELSADQQRLAEIRVVADHLADSGRRVSRRALRAAGLRGSNAELGSIARLFSGGG
jgi:hypothetical protein